MRDDPDLRFEFCSALSGVHYPNDAGRELHAVYHLLSVTHGRRVRLEVACPDDDPHIPSVVSVYPTADWQERETWDFFGIQSSTATRPSPGSRCPTTGPATRSARTTRSAASPSSTRARPSRRPDTRRSYS